MSFSSKDPSTTYKDILQIDNSNSGVNATARDIKDGAGVSTSSKISKDHFQVKPLNSDTTSTFAVYNKGGDELIKVDSTNKRLYGNGHFLNSQIAHFGLHNFTPVATTHHPMLANHSGYYTAVHAEQALGTSTDPTGSLDVSSGSTAFNWVPYLFYMPLNAVVDEAVVLASAEDSSAFTFHLVEHSIDTSTNYGDLGSQSIVGTHASTTIAETQIKKVSLTISNPNVTAGNVLMAFVETQGTDDIYVNMMVRYHFAP